MSQAEDIKKQQTLLREVTNPEVSVGAVKGGKPVSGSGSKSIPPVVKIGEVYEDEQDRTGGSVPLGHIGGKSGNPPSTQ